MKVLNINFMKQLNSFMDQVEHNRGKCKLRFLLLFVAAIWMCVPRVYSQGIEKVFWTEGRTVSSGVFAVGGESGTLDIHFSLPQDGENVSVIVTLPPYFSYSDVTTGEGHSENVILGTIQQSSQTVTIPLGEVEALETVYLQLTAKAAKGAENNNENENMAVIQVKAGEETLGGISPDMIAKVPLLQVIPVEKELKYTDAGEIQTFKLNLTSAEAEANRFEIRITVPEKVTLQNFVLDGSPLTEGDGYTVNSSRSLFTIKQTEPGILLNEEPKILEFDASCSVTESQDLTVTARYPSHSLNYSEASATKLQMIYAVEGGQPLIKHYFEGETIQTYYVASTDPDAPKIERENIPMDCTTTTYVKAVFVNDENATATAAQLKFSASTYDTAYGFIDLNNIYYQVEGDNEPTLLDPSYISKKTKLGDRNLATSAIRGYISPQFENEYYSISGSLPDDVLVPVGKRLTLWIATKNGVIYNNENNNVYNDYSTEIINGFTINITSCKSTTGGDGSVLTRSVAITYLGVPHFREIPVAHIYKPEGNENIFEQKIRFASNYLSSKSTFEVKVEFPEWLEMDENYPYEWQTKDGSKFADTEVNLNNEHQIGILTYPSKTGAETQLTFRFKVKANTYTENKSGQIHYRINLLLDGTDASRMNHISQVIQPVHLQTLSGDVELKTFELRRATLGYIDMNDNGIPDNGDKWKERDNDPDHTIYLEGDLGKIVWEGIVLEEYNGGALYLPALLSEKLLLNTLDFKEPLFFLNGERDGTTQNITLSTNTGNNEILIKHTGVLSLGTEFRIELPFKVISGINTIGSIQTKCLISDDITKSPTFANPDECNGNDYASSAWGTYGLAQQMIGFGSNYTLTFYDNNPLPENTSMGYLDILHSSRLTSPYFNKEARCLAYPEKLEWTIPEGYQLINNKLKMVFTLSNKSGHPKYEAEVIGVEEDGKLVFYMKDLFDFDQRGATYDLLPGKYFPFPDDRWVINLTGSLQALKNAPASVKSVQKVYYKNLEGKEMGTASRTNTINYVGSTIGITPQEPTKSVSGLEVNTNITVSNPNDGLDLKNVWLYFDGPVKDVAYTQGQNRTEGEGKWLYLGEIASMANPVYNVTFKQDTEAEVAGNYTVRIYTVSGFTDQTWEPADYGMSINDIPEEKLGRNSTMTVQPQASSLSGSLGLNITELVYESPYKLTATLTTEGSKGSVKSAAMEITIPIGQKFESGVIRYNGAELPLGELETTLTGLDEAGGTFTFDASDYITDGMLLGSTGITAATQGQQKISLDAIFVPTCETNPAETRITAVLYGEKPAGGEVTGSGTTIYAPRVLARTSANFNFSVTMDEVSGLYYTSGTKGRVKFTITKNTQNAVKAGTFLELRLPSVLSVDPDGSILMNSTGLGFHDEPATIENEDMGNDTYTRTITILLPADKYSGADNGQGKTLTYTVPVVYTLTAVADESYSNLSLNPVKEIEASVWTLARFGTCEGNEIAVPVGIGTANSAFLLTEEMPVRAFAGSQAEMKILSAGFSGKVNGTEVTNGLYSFIPSESTYNDGTTGIASGILVQVPIAVKFAETDYGSVNGNFRVYPSLKYDLQSSVSNCGPLEDITLSSYISNQVSTLTAVKFYSNEECTSEVNATDLRTINSTVTYYAKAINNGVVNGVEVETKKILFTINPLTTITSDLDDTETIYVDHNSSKTLSITASNASGYAWYKDNSMISGETNNTLTITEAGSYYVLALSANCQNVKSNVVNVEVYPDLAITVESPVYLCDNVTGGINLADYVTSGTGVTLEYYESGTKLGSSVVVPSLTTTYEVKPKNAGGSYGTTAEITVIVEKAPRITTHPQSRYLNAGTAPLQVIATGDYLTYQWEKEESGIFTAIPGANEEIYDATETGRYRVVVTGTTTACGVMNVTSNMATVSTYIPPQTEMYRITTEAAFGDIRVTLYPSETWSISSGSYVDGGATIKVNATPSEEWAGLELTELTANGEPIANGQLLQIWENTHIYAKFQVDGHDPDPDDPGVGNMEIDENGMKIWVANEILYIQTEETRKAYVISLSGTIVAARDLTIGENRFWLPRGAYIVRVGEQVTKVIVR